tara:strand:+ start:740 stop:1489 length:750 start_codon:yes stop_codon:yes gene_type:complete
MKLKEFKDLKVKFNGFESINKNYSESFQDIFVLQCFNGKKNGTYLEIGAGDPINGNNTYLLSDKFGWEGLSIDYGYDGWDGDVVITVDGKEFTWGQFQEHWNKVWFKDRRIEDKLLLSNALTCDYIKLVDDGIIPPVIDYLQLDIDRGIDNCEINYELLRKIPFDNIDFKVITYEHNIYDTRYVELALESRRYLESKGYILIAGNISNIENKPYEDWWVNLKYINEINPLIIRNTFECNLSVEKYMFNE